MKSTGGYHRSGADQFGGLRGGGVDRWLERPMVAPPRPDRIVSGRGLAIVGGILVSRVILDANILRLLPRDSPAV